MGISWLFAQESTVSKNYEGKDFSQLKHTWKAQWITHPTASTMDYGVFLFRRTFSMETIPERFIVHVSADNRYRLFVNGEQVCFGPARGDLLNWRYETVDIAGHLRQGKNAVAAEVVNFGEYRHAAQHTFQTAFILQNEEPSGVSINTGDKKWKVSKNDAYTCIPFTTDSLHGYYCAGPGDRIDGSLYPWHWQDADFEDNTWSVPRLATVEFAVGRGFLYGSTWFLVPRNIPFLQEKIVRMEKVARSAGLRADIGFLNGDNPLDIPPHTKVSLLLDQKRLTIGYPEIVVSRGAGSRIKITYAEALCDKNGLKGNRDEIEGKSILGYYDIIFPDGGENRRYRTLWWKTYRFVQLDIATGDQKLSIDDFYGKFTAYPFEENATFECDNPLFATIWDNSWRTLRLTSGETFRDPYYEQLQYIGDTRIEALISIYVAGDDRLMRNAIEHFDNSRVPCGLTQSRYPSYIYQIIPTYSLIWIDMLHDYFMYRDDPEFLRQFLPGMRDVLRWFEDRIDDTGMLGALEWWNFTDWSEGFQNGIPPGADDGHSACISLQYVYSLQNAVELYGYFNWEHEASRCKQISENVINAVYDNCFDEGKGLFAETPDKMEYSQHTNIFAVLTQAISTEQSIDLMKKILKEPDLIMCTLYFKFYLFRALQKSGLGDEYQDQLEPWKNMIAMGLTTFAETDVNPRSECHAWSASPNFDFLHLIAGIHPAEPGFKSVIVAPNFGDLTYIRASMPHPAGEIKVDLRRSPLDEVTGEISLPENLTGTFVWRDKRVELKSGVQEIYGGR